MYSIVVNTRHRVTICTQSVSPSDPEQDNISQSLNEMGFERGLVFLHVV